LFESFEYTRAIHKTERGRAVGGLKHPIMRSAVNNAVQ
jgi:hypothetical protein